jgi:hypothetical protein
MKDKLLKVLSVLSLLGISDQYHVGADEEVTLIEIVEDSLVEVKGDDESESRDRRHSRHETKEFHKKGRVGPYLEDPIPNVIFHGVRQVCSEILLTNLVE